MAEEKFTVVYECQRSGLAVPTFEKASVEGKNKNKSYNEGSGTSLLTGAVQKANIVTVIAESAEEAAKIVAQQYGNTNAKVLAGKSSGLSEVNAAP